MSSVSLPETFPSLGKRELTSCLSVRRSRSLSNLGTRTSSPLDIEQERRNSATLAPGFQRSRPQFVPPPMERQVKHVAIDVPDASPTHADDFMVNGQPRGMFYTEPSSEQKRREQERHMLGLFEQYSGVKSSANRNYNYEDKYPEDQPGDELGPNARFFNVYLDEAEKYDDDMIRGLSGTLDALLVFAALFSAVVTTFVVDTSHVLEPDQALITSSLLFEQIQLLRANGNSTVIAAITQSQYTPESATHSNSDVWINGLFFASLSLSLATALLSVLAKQWLQAYTSVTSGSARDTALIRHLRFMGFEEWKVPQIIGFLPLILHASLAVFIAGLIVFLRSLYPRLSWVVVGIAGPAFFVYLVSIVLPAIYIRCPYRITVLYTPIKTIILLFELPLNRLRRWHWSIDYQHWWRRLCRGLLKAFHNVSTAFTSAILFIFSKVFPPASTLKHSELLLVQNSGSCRPVLCDGIVWLHNESSNLSVRHVAVCSFAGKDFDYIFSFEAKKFQLSKLHLTAVSAEKELWDPSKVSSLTHRAATRLADTFRDHDLRPNDLQKDWFDAASYGRTNEVAFLHHVWKFPADSRAINGGTALQSAALNYHYATTKLLLQFGADPDAVSPAPLFGNTAFSLVCRFRTYAEASEMAKLLLDAGADINLRGPDKYSWTPLYSASLNLNTQLIEWLIENGADVDKIGGDLGTALHVASRSNNSWGAKVLLGHGATVNLKNAEGQTALGVAIKMGSSEVEALLREHGATE